MTDTDYDFPPMWGRMSPEQKSRWYTQERVRRQVSRQRQSGMWSQWSGSRCEDRIPFANAIQLADKNDYQIK